MALGPAQLPALAVHHYHGINWDFDILLMSQLQKQQKILGTGRYKAQEPERHQTSHREAHPDTGSGDWGDVWVSQPSLLPLALTQPVCTLVEVEGVHGSIHPVRSHQCPGGDKRSSFLSWAKKDRGTGAQPAHTGAQPAHCPCQPSRHCRHPG